MSDSFGPASDTAIEHAAADAVAGLNKDASGQDTVCLNCNTPLTGDYCHHCGQSARSLRRPFTSLIGESIETLFAVDGRVWQTLPAILLRPGKATRAYLDGQRMRFIPPFRLYVLSSLIFFIILPLVMGQGLGLMPGGAHNFEDARAEITQAYEAGNMSEADYESALLGVEQAEALWRGGIPGVVSVTPPQVPGETPAPPPAAEGEWAGFMPQEALDAIREAGEQGDPDAARLADVLENPGQLISQTMRWIPRMMFVLLPIYACLLAVLYLWRPQFLFFDHLIVSLHFHSALFLMMSLGILVSSLGGAAWVALALLLYANWYLYRVGRVVYQRGAISSVVRVLMLNLLYGCVLLTALVTAVILGAVSIW